VNGNPDEIFSFVEFHRVNWWSGRKIEKKIVRKKPACPPVGRERAGKK